MFLFFIVEKVPENYSAKSSSTPSLWLLDTIMHAWQVNLKVEVQRANTIYILNYILTLYLSRSKWPNRTHNATIKKCVLHSFEYCITWFWCRWTFLCARYKTDEKSESEWKRSCSTFALLPTRCSLCLVSGLIFCVVHLLL